jgi:hypothetical protein
MWRTLWPRSRRTSTSRRPARFRPCIEVLEGRCLPSTLTVTTTADSGPGSLRADLAAAKSGDTIVFSPSLDGQTINLTSGELSINKSVNIQGPGAGLLTVSGDGLSRVFDVKNGQTVVLSGMTITGGDGQAASGAPKQSDVVSGADGFGGAILNLGNLTLSDCTVTGNSADSAGAIANGFHSGGAQSTLTVTNCNITDNSATTQAGGIYNVTNATVSNTTLSGNTAGLDGGAIFNSPGGEPTSINSLTISGCTVTGNSAGRSGGGIANVGGAVTVGTSTFSANSPDNIFGSFTDGGGNTFA